MSKNKESVILLYYVLFMNIIMELSIFYTSIRTYHNCQASLGLGLSIGGFHVLRTLGGGVLTYNFEKYAEEVVKKFCFQDGRG